MTPLQVTWIYIVLLVAGGLAGYLKARSKASLIMSLIFAAALAASNLGMIPFKYATDILLVVLLFFFGSRFARSGKMMPGGLMSLLTVAALALRHLL